MLYLIISILLNAGIFIGFRTFAHFGVRTLPAIVINYYVCVLTGLAFPGNRSEIPALLSPDNNWIYAAALLGLLFIFTFNLMAITAQRLSVTVSSVAAKMSLVVPVIFSLFIFQIESKPFDAINYLGLLFTIVAVYLSAIKEKEKEGALKLKNRALLLLPFAVFVCSGIIDTLINYTNYRYLTDAEAGIFPIVIFLVAAVTGTAILLFKKEFPGAKEITGGICLGIPNYFSIYFIVKALGAFDNNGAVFYPVLNINIILFSSLLAILFFKEKLLKINKVGLILAIIAIFLISYQEITGYFT